MKQNNYDGALQQPIGSGFTATTTATEVMQGQTLFGKRAIVTGGNTGIGLETTRALAAAGAQVVVGARDLEKARRNLAGLPNVEVEKLDLMDPASIDAFAASILDRKEPLHMLVNNAGIMWVPLRRDSRGLESQLATNYLAQFQLTARLWPALKKAGAARVVNLSSQGHQFAPFDFTDPNFHHRPYETLLGYGQSKTATNLFTVELDQRGSAHGVRAYAVHPGSIGGTELGREAPVALLQQMGFYDAEGKIRPAVAASLKTVAQGAATTLWCATSPLLQDLGGIYCADAEVAELITGPPDPAGQQGVCRYSLDRAQAATLWQWTEETLGFSFPAA